MEKIAELQKSWEKTGKSPFFGILKSAKGESLSEALKSVSELWKNAFDANQEKSKVLICADERMLPLEGEFKVGIAGQLILSPEDCQKRFIDDLKGKIKTVRSHSGCGAAGIAYSQLSEKEKQQSTQIASKLPLNGDVKEEMSQGDLYGACHSHELAKKLGANFEHVSFSAMRGNRDFHDARMIFWSADPAFDPSILAGNFLPPHFLANGLAFGLDEKYCEEELKILSGIALGSHGFGELFDSCSPFLVISVGKNLEEAEKMNKIAKERLREFGDRIKFKSLC